jgi:hypothetical protein
LAEQRMAELIRKFVKALEFGMIDLMENPAPSKYQKHADQKSIHNVIVTLKTKCSVKFEDDDDDQYRRNEPLVK